MNYEQKTYRQIEADFMDKTTYFPGLRKETAYKILPNKAEKLSDIPVTAPRDPDLLPFDIRVSVLRYPGLKQLLKLFLQKKA